MSKIKKRDLLTLLQEQAEMIVELSSMIKMNKQSIIKLENEREQNSIIERDKVELTGSDLCRAMLERGDKFVLCFMSYTNDATAEFHERAEIVLSHDDKGFYVHDEYWQSAVPINNQGEPLTQSDVGL